MSDSTLNPSSRTNHSDHPQQEEPVSGLGPERGTRLPHAHQESAQSTPAPVVSSSLLKRGRSSPAGERAVGTQRREAARTSTSRQQLEPSPPTRCCAESLEFEPDYKARARPAAETGRPQAEPDSEVDERPLKRARLTQENLSLFTNMTKNKKKSSASAAPEPGNDAATTRTTSTTASGFAIQAFKNGILDASRSKPPRNLEEIQTRHTQPRKTASPTESMHERYDDKVGSAPNEATVAVEVGRRILKDYEDQGYQTAFNQAFTGFPKAAGFNNGLSAPQPDFVEGLEMQDYSPFPVDELDGAVLYKDSPRSLTLPHLAGEWKGPGKDMVEARLQSGYDGAALVYARNQALKYVGKPDPAGHAEVTTFTTDGTTVNFFAHYAVPSEEDDSILQYHQYQYASENIKNSYHGHKNGRRGIRNAQDHAKQQSYALRKQLREHWKQHGRGAASIAEDAIPSTADDTVTGEGQDKDGVESGYEVVGQMDQLTPLPSSSQHGSSHQSSPGTNPPKKRKASAPASKSRESTRKTEEGRRN